MHRVAIGEEGNNGTVWSLPSDDTRLSEEQAGCYAPETAGPYIPPENILPTPTPTPLPVGEDAGCPPLPLKDLFGHR